MHQHPPGVVGPATDVYRHVLPLDDPRTIHPRGGRRHDLCHPPQRSHSKEDAHIAGTIFDLISKYALISGHPFFS